MAPGLLTANHRGVVSPRIFSPDGRGSVMLSRVEHETYWPFVGLAHTGANETVTLITLFSP